MSKTNMTKQQQAIIASLFGVLLIIPLVELYTEIFLIHPMLISIMLFAVILLNQIFEQKQPLTRKQKNILLLWGGITMMIVVLQQYAFIAMLVFPVFQMKRMREELEKESLLPRG